MERGLRLNYPPETPVGGFIVFAREKAPFAKVLTSRGRVPRLSVRVCVRMQIVPPVSVSRLYLDKRGLTQQLHATVINCAGVNLVCMRQGGGVFCFFLRSLLTFFSKSQAFFCLFLRHYLKPEHNSVC